MVSNGEESNVETLELPKIKEWITAAEAAKLTGVSRQYLHTLLKRKYPDVFPSASTLGNLLVLKLDEVEAWNATRR